ncbi:hypothetical protein [uncultured Maricaulis sp.]|uniref:hypothetical protein n=1 Tax=uncultured Maricaulis sp. TaxID=174710 RepID=UPI0030D87D25|tara:strand:+ start:57796 stop:58269 length:474 start_codon:yes stop_codon:yes gene_type:complete
MFDTMFDPTSQFETLQEDVLHSLESAMENGLSTVRGAAAFHQAMERLDRLSEIKADQIYAPLSADPLSRDYVLHLDEQLLGLMGRIDVLRTHVELGLETGSDNATGLRDSLQALLRQLKISFSREAALIPVYVAWQEREAMRAPPPPPELQLVNTHP